MIQSVILDLATFGLIIIVFFHNSDSYTFFNILKFSLIQAVTTQSMTERRIKTGTCICNIGSRAYRKFVEVRHETKLPNKYKQKDEKIKAVRKGKDHNQRTIRKIIREEGQTKRPPWLRNTTCKRMLG